MPPGLLAYAEHDRVSLVLGGLARTCLPPRSERSPTAKVCTRTVLDHRGTKDTKGSGYFEPQSLEILLFFVPLVTFVVGPSVEPPNREPQDFSANSAPASSRQVSVVRAHWAARAVPAGRPWVCPIRARPRLPLATQGTTARLRHQSRPGPGARPGTDSGPVGPSTAPTEPGAQTRHP